MKIIWSFSGASSIWHWDLVIIRFLLLIQELPQIFHNLIDSLLIPFKVLVCVDDQYLFLIILFEPFLMLTMNHLQVLQRNFRLLRSHSCLGSLVTSLGTASEINDFSLVDVGRSGKILEQLFINLVLTVLHVTELFHDLCKNVLVS